MKSLIQKVRTIEDEVKGRIATAEEEGRQRVAELKSGEHTVLADIRQRAEEKAAGIVRDKKRAAENEINAMQQDRERATDNVASASHERQAEAVARALQLFEEEYLSSERV